MIVIDTNILIRWLVWPDKLSKKAKFEIEKAKTNREIIISSISIWEICLLVKTKRLSLTVDLNTWIEKLEALPFVQFAPVDNKIARKSVFLNGHFHKDPADRIIVATALVYGVKLITSDRKIRNYKEVNTIW
jgi:PIN domain nuclease of toxin-antitoxin system